MAFVTGDSAVWTPGETHRSPVFRVLGPEFGDGRLVGLPGECTMCGVRLGTVPPGVL